MAKKETNSALSSPTGLLGYDGSGPGTVAASVAAALTGANATKLHRHPARFLPTGVRIKPPNVLARATLALTSGRAYYVPFFWPDAAPPTNLHFEITTGAAINVCCAIYVLSESDGKLGTRLFRSTDIDITSFTGFKDVTLSGVSSMTTGWYVFGFAVGGAGASARGIGSAMPSPWGAGTSCDTIAAKYRAETYASALPSTAPDIASGFTDGLNDQAPMPLFT